MTSDETKNYIDQRLHELGLALHLDAGGYEKIHRFTNGTESGVNQLCFKLASLTADSDEREVTTDRVTKAIDELARIDDMMRRATKSDVRQANDELERTSIDQLAAVLEANAAVASATAEAYAPPRPATRSKAAAKRAAGERHPKILIVNESKTTRGLLVKALTPDFECIETADAEDAWRRLVHQTDIELAITDVRPHDRAQYDLIGRVRSASAPAHLIGLPIIAMAVTEDAHAKQRALVAGANDVIAMNTSAGELKTRVSARYKASRVAPQYGAPASKPVAGERTPERKKNAMPPPAPRPTARPAVTSTMAALAPGPLENVRRPFLNTSDMMRHVPAVPSRFLAWLYKVSSTTTVTLSATILVVVLLAAIMYVNRMSDSPVTARAPERPAPALQADAQPTPPPTTTPPTTQPTSPPTAQPTPSEPSTPLAAAPSPTDRASASADTKSKAVPKEEPRREREPAATVSPAPTAQARAEPALPVEPPAPRARPEPSLPTPRATGPETRPTTPATAPATPLPSDNAVARESDVGVDTDAARSAAAKPVAPERLTRDELATLLKRFTYVYEAGDIEQFMNLFAPSARTNDRANRDGIRQDYETLFRTTDLRQFKLSHINWEVDNNQAHGWGNFEVTVRRTGDQELHNYSGSLTLYVERIEGRPRIVRLFHGQRRAGSS